MNLAEKEIEYAELVKIHKKSSPIVSGCYNSLDIIDTKIQALLSYIGMQIVAITFVSEFVGKPGSAVPGSAFLILYSLLLSVCVVIIIASAVIQVTCLNIFGPDHKELMNGLQKLRSETSGTDAEIALAKEVTMRVARITGSRRRRYRFALRLALLSSVLLGVAIILRWNSWLVESLSGMLS